MIRIALLGSILLAAGCANPVQEPPPPPVVVAKPLFELSFSNLLSFPDSDDEKPGMAYVTIRKNDPDCGWVEWKKIQREGERLGWVTEDGKQNSLHRVFSAKLGKMVKLDFDTKATLKRIVTEKLVVYESRQCPILQKPMVQCPGPIALKGTYKVDEAVVAWDSGKSERFTKLSGPGPLQDALCSSHGGQGVP
ncbi:MAG TPA: hypothetical protein VJU16_04855, partial [Planctomycetota bacterium]|nr:hypothetical protein [Planctomycetota bacterium]